MFHNKDLENDIQRIKDCQKDIEETGYKMLVEKAEDETLDYQYIIDVEDTSYSYPTVYDRDNDYNELCKLLSKNSTNYIYGLS